MSEETGTKYLAFPLPSTDTLLMDIICQLALEGFSIQKPITVHFKSDFNAMNCMLFEQEREAKEL